jgi:two-component system LytT family response regulator
MSYKCMIVDDEELARELVASHLSRLDNFELVASCESAVEALQLMQKVKIDLLFLDIEMPVLKGHDFYKHLITKPKVIFTTAYRDYALDGFELSAVDFLLKPIVLRRFMAAIEKFLESTKQSELPMATAVKEDFIYIQHNKKNIKIQLDEILFIESMKDYIRIQLSNNKITVKHAIGAFEEKLDDRFLRVHRSFLVNADKITAYTKQDVGRQEIPIGESYKKDTLSRLGI